MVFNLMVSPPCTILLHKTNLKLAEERHSQILPLTSFPSFLALSPLNQDRDGDKLTDSCPNYQVSFLVRRNNTNGRIEIRRRGGRQGRCESSSCNELPKVCWDLSIPVVFRSQITLCVTHKVTKGKDG